MRALLTLSALVVLGSAADAQSLWTIDTAGTVTGQTGPAAGACGYPLGPLLAQWSHVTPGICATPLATGGGAGDVGMNRALDQLWITDGFVAASYATYGTPLETGIDVASLLGGPVTGIDWDPSLAALWVTDGTSAVAAAIQLSGFCYDAVPLSSFALPTAAPATALSYDALTDTLWVVDATGMLTQVTKTGALGPLGSANVTATSGCGLAPGLTGVAVDSAGPAGRIYVTDGITIAAVDMSAGGVAAAPTFYSPASCFPALTPSCDGLTVAATGNVFGAASGGFLPVIGAKGQSIVPNPTLAIEVGGAKNLDVAILVLGTGYLCPAPLVLGVPFHVAPAPLIVAATVIVDATGFASKLLPLGVPTPIGKTVYLQWGIYTPSTGKVSSTRGMAMTTSLP
jgi:hypothetical protein